MYQKIILVLYTLIINGDLHLDGGFRDNKRDLHKIFDILTNNKNLSWDT